MVVGKAAAVIVSVVLLAAVLGLARQPATAQDIDEAARLQQQAIELFQKGRYAEAETLFKRVLKIAEKLLGAEHPVVAESLNNLGNLYKIQGRYSEAEPLLRRSLEMQERALGPNHTSVALPLVNLGSLYYEQGRYAEAGPLYERSLEIREKALGADHPDVAKSLWGVGLSLFSQARFTEAERHFKRALEIAENALGPDHPEFANHLNNLASIYDSQGRYAEEESLLSRTLKIREKALGPDHPDVALSLNNLAVLYVKQGRYADAEPLHRRALVIREKALGSEHPDVATSLLNLAYLYSEQGRYDEAEPLFARSLAIKEKVLGPNHPRVSWPLAGLAQCYTIQSRYADAEQLYKRALTVREKALGPNHPDVANLMHDLAYFYDLQGRHLEAEPLYRRSLEIKKNIFGEGHISAAASLHGLASDYQLQGRYSEAEPLFKRALEINERSLSPEHYLVAGSLNSLAEFYADRGRYEDGLPIVRRAINLGKASPYPALSILIGAERAGLISKSQSFADSYMVLQGARSSAAADAVKKLAPRIAAESGELAGLVRQETDLEAEAEHLAKSFVAMVSKAPGMRDKATEQALQKRLAEIALERQRLSTLLEARFPDYLALANPQPLSLEETQELLAADEAIVAFEVPTFSGVGPVTDLTDSTSSSPGYAWVVTKTSADWVEIPASAKDLALDIKKLRWSLTFAQSGRDVPFDSDLAYSTYKKTFGPIAEKLKGKTRLSVLANGPLTSIPFGMLITSDPEGKALKDVDWLIKSYAITVIPSIYSLKTMRAYVAAVGAEKPMIAFADPVFSEADPEGKERQVAQRSLSHFYRGSQLDAESLAEALPQLPGTRIEVDRIAKGLNVPKEDLKFGQEATETAVKRSKLDDYRVVYFATHGLVAGDLEEFAKSKAEPALALTFPDEPDDMDNGLLEASEIAKLKMNAEWVVLSACNTASSDGVGAEPLSGLARAFIYAGGRSLVVSHWDVSDDATAELMSDLFEISKDKTTLSHGEMMREAKLNLLNSATSDDEAHPRVWAPFVVVGEPGVSRPRSKHLGSVGVH